MATTTKSAGLPRADILRSLGAGWRRFLLLFLVLGSLSSVPLLLQTSHVTTTEYRLREPQLKREQWLSLNAALEAQIAEASSLRRADSIARKELGMVEPTEYIFVTVSAPPDQAALPAPRATVQDAPSANPSGWKAVLQALAFWRG